MAVVVALTGGVVAIAWLLVLLGGVVTSGPGLRSGAQRPGHQAPTPVVVVVPMRDEAAHAEACVRALLATTHAPVRVVVVDDRSTDGTRAVVDRLAAGDARLEVVTGAELPHGWVGKPWACHQGAQAAGLRTQATDGWVVFCDADVRLTPDAIGLLLADAAAHDARVVSWVGLQELLGFAERVVSPQILLAIAVLTPMPLAQRPGSSVTAVNGQLLAFRADAYSELGGHAAVHDAVVEDLALGRAAKRCYGAGYRFVWARSVMSTRMYTSWAQVVEGWSKNMALGAGVLGAPAVTVALGPLVASLGPWIGTLGWVLGVQAAWPWAVAALAQVVAVGIFGWRFSRLAPWWALAAPLGAVGVTWIAIRSAARTRRGNVTWRGRSYAARR